MARPTSIGIELLENLLCNRNLQKAYLINGLIVKSKTIIKCPNWLDNVIIGLETESKQPARSDQELVQDRSEIEKWSTTLKLVRQNADKSPANYFPWFEPITAALTVHNE